ncbi:MAG: 50S ribosomal protein L29 [Deltaproteobacteria bacterium]|nr:50S ribosomal protein L29 [Deltaproteobacteria bacterium]MBK8241456.1 50S ribosomal protein L29 [Deltaproteobacteria bacterium]MBK8717168.1 50S ribosomal protein L29 [Deltaproteobacteria bacterium]MBP7286308.1 50S ribosomal protein L29 [Nannocystaceae bacterium]
MKPSELRDKSDDELVTLEKDLRDQLIKLGIARATQRMRNSAQLGKLKRDIARIKTIVRERELGLATGGRSQSEAST